MLAAVKPLKTANLAIGRNQMAERGTELVADAGSKSNDLEALFQRHHDRVFRAAYRVTGSAADAEDVLQTVFLRLARGTEPVAPENPDGYFARAAINASLDLLRSRKRSRAVAIDDVDHHSVPMELVTRSTPESNEEDRELRNLIREAVSKLGDTAGQMFALRYFEGYDNGEIGRMMNTSAIVVGVTLHRARARLRKEIGNYLQMHQ
ncbi:MAG TPA: sigma-70 family RNA polymerase sigma factor [Pyrinomonadaceae bacterium]|nr:sigma-70 family RNA polymerase sigma factor [Pyrinomonadaceae bacterium]